MTICIAGIAEDKKIVAVTDKMLTIGAPVATKFEVGANNKAIKLSEKVLAMFAGDVLQANQILKLALEKIQAASTESVLGISNLVVEAYKEQWNKVVQENLFNRYGINLAIFMGNHMNLDSDLVRKTNEVLSQYNISVEIIIAGIDSVPHLYKVSDPGTLNCFDSIGYVCIGSGSQHATLSLVESEYASSIAENEALYALLESKKKAEYDPGVGALCDIVLINDFFKKVEDSNVKEVLHLYSKSVLQLKNRKKKSSVGIFKKANE